MKIESHLSHSRVRFDQDTDGHVVLSLTAPPLATEAKRPRICIVPVIDVSPSMRGEKFHYAQRSILKLVDHLGADDYCGLIQFSYTAEVLQRPVRMTSEAKEELKRKVGDLKIGSATNIADALLTGLKVANDMDLAADVITRVILFTDGEANTGPAIKDADILALMVKNVGLASVSAFGYGLDAKQSLLSDIAKTAKGNYAFVQHPDAALTAFGRELGGLTSTYAMDIVLRVQPVSGHQITSVVSDVEADENHIGQITVKIPDLLADETRHIVLAAKFAKQKNAFPRAFKAFEVKASYDIIDANGQKERVQFEDKLKIQFTKPGEEQEKPLPEIDAIIGRAQIVRAQIEAENHAKRGDYVSANAVMKTFAADLHARGHAALEHVANGLGDRMANASLYASNAGYLTSMSRGGTRGTGVACYDAAAESDLNSMGVSTTTSNTARLGSEFREGIGDAIGAAKQDPDYTVIVNPTSPNVGNALWVVDASPYGHGWGTSGGTGTVNITPNPIPLTTTPTHTSLVGVVNISQTAVPPAGVVRGVVRPSADPTGDTGHAERIQEFLHRSASAKDEKKSNKTAESKRKPVKQSKSGRW